ncbi:predicted protein [Lichtheimia corymbifera JMRC:FSU:9682]|uniref:C2H2-type domain-containing protein n=1 Tax=Lichtheimia corymbifera JMRC:FSU:9682 TaxID=1263082 RepID=A0A068RER1_9FUNG|nr:predicted protein [Lichtheimia corymbifera JMRC:FSU:9682]
MAFNNDDSHNSTAHNTSIPGFNLAVPIPTPPSTSVMAWSLSPPSAAAAAAAAANTQHRDSFGHRQELESMFYRDLVCCNKKIEDLHHLLRHYEDHHHNHEPMAESVDSHPPPLLAQAIRGAISGRRVDNDDDMDEGIAISRMEGIESSHHHPHHAATSSSHDAGYRLQHPPQQQQQHHQDDTLMPIIPGGTLHPTQMEEDESSVYPPNTNATSSINPHHHQQQPISLPPLSTTNTTTTPALHITPVNDPTRPYKCTIPGCTKAYKNANGLKYHREHGHVETGEEDILIRPYRCALCNKGYRQMSGLKYHMTHGHP